MENSVRENLKQSYNNFAHIREKKEMQEWKRKPREEFLKLVKEEDKLALLEVGAGHGRDSKYFKDNGLQVVAVDLSDEMVKLCCEKGIEAYELDFSELSMLDKTFDAVWAMNCLLHIEKKNICGVLQGIRDVLNHSGLFYMGMYGGNNHEGIYEEDFYTPKRYFARYTDDSIRALIEQYFNVISFERINTGDDLHFQSIVMRKK